MKVIKYCITLTHMEMTIFCSSFNLLIIITIFLVLSDSKPKKNQNDEHDYRSGHRRLGILSAKVKSPIAILGLPFSKGQTMSGTELAPHLFRQQKLLNQIKRLGYESVIDHGDMEFHDAPKDTDTKTKNKFSEIRNQFTLAKANKQVEQRVAHILEEGHTLVLLGGDHSLTAGAILGDALVNGDICVIYIDGHGDINTCESTTSGNFHGMPLSFVINEINADQNNFKSCPAMKILKPRIPASALAHLAARDLDDNELDIINKYNIKYYSMKDIDNIGIAEAVIQILETTCASKSKIHVSFDIDSLDTVYTPNTGTTVPGGLTVREALQIGELVAQTKKLSVISMYEVNPTIEPKRMANQTANVAMNIILSFLGKSREVYWAQAWEGGWGERNDKEKDKDRDEDSDE